MTRWPRCLPVSGHRFDTFAGPITDNTGKEVLAEGAKLEQSDLDQFPPGAPGNECATCMYWWADGITVELPKLEQQDAGPPVSHRRTRHRRSVTVTDPGAPVRG